MYSRQYKSKLIKRKVKDLFRDSPPSKMIAMNEGVVVSDHEMNNVDPEMNNILGKKLAKWSIEFNITSRSANKLL